MNLPLYSLSKQQFSFFYALDVSAYIDLDLGYCNFLKIKKIKQMNIYVGNLPWTLGSEDLKELFTAYGEVTSAKIVTDRLKNNRSKGFGFVEMPDDAAAESAINALNESEIGGRKIVVNQKMENSEGPRRRNFDKEY